jgi:hypothetical protein
MTKLSSQPSGKQRAVEGAEYQPRERIAGSTAKHTYNVSPASVQSTGGGKISPNSHSRGPQG